MSDILPIILPLILMVAAGWVITRLGLLTSPDWAAIEKFSFKILIPALIIRAIYRSELSLATSAPYIGTMVLAIAAAGGATLALRPIIRPERLPSTQLSTMFQVTTRWNAFIVLPIADQLFGAIGLTAIAVAMAFLIPLINISNIGVISILHAHTASPGRITKQILTNPLVISSLTGLAINYSGLQPPQAVDMTLDLIGRGALAIGLLCIGAGFNWQKLMRPTYPVVWGVTIKLIAAPMLFLLLAILFNLNPMETLCGMLVVSAPTATNGYIITKQMGGDAELYSFIMSWQLVLSVITIPAMIAITGNG